jgi:hypothetical protein
MKNHVEARVSPDKSRWETDPIALAVRHFRFPQTYCGGKYLPHTLGFSSRTALKLWHGRMIKSSHFF